MIAETLINCNDCKPVCCKRGYILLLHDEFLRLKCIDPNIETDDFQYLHFMNTPCKFLRDDKCSIYDDRPDSCRIYPFHIEYGLFEVSIIFHPECQKVPRYDNKKPIPISPIELKKFYGFNDKGIKEALLIYCLRNNKIKMYRGLMKKKMITKYEEFNKGQITHFNRDFKIPIINNLPIASFVKLVELQNQKLLLYLKDRLKDKLSNDVGIVKVNTKEFLL
jgi:Fe-S-cluster containining protein